MGILASKLCLNPAMCNVHRYRKRSVMSIYRGAKKTPVDLYMLGTLEFSIYWMEDKKYVLIENIKGLDVMPPKKDVKRSLEITLHNMSTFYISIHTEFVQNSSEFVCEESIQLDDINLKDLTMSIINIKIVDSGNFFTSKVKGEIHFPLKLLKNVKNIYRVFQIQPIAGYCLKDHQGELLLSLRYDKEAAMLFIKIIRACQLEVINFSDKSNPYAKLLFQNGESKILTRETKKIYRSKDPIFNELFSFNVPLSEIVQSTVTICIMDYEFSKDKNHCGYIKLGTNANNGCEFDGYHLWHTLLNNLIQEAEVVQWLKLKQPSMKSSASIQFDLHELR